VSYDLYLFRKDEGDPAAAYERLDELEESDPTPAERERLRRLRPTSRPPIPTSTSPSRRTVSLSSSATKTNDRW
jgi:hypothetical protein